MAELSQEAVAQEEQTQQSTQVATDPEAGMSTEEKLLKRSDEIKKVLDSIQKEEIDPSLYTDILESFTDEKKEELQAIVEEVNDPLGKKTITLSTIENHYTYSPIAYQEVWMKDGVITKYGNFVLRGFVDDYSLGTTEGANNIVLPLPNDVEFDMLLISSYAFYARPKAGQSNVGGISGSLDNILFCLGNNAYGQLGNGKTGQEITPYTHKFSARVKKLVGFSNGDNSNQGIFCLLENGELHCCGYNGSGNLGLGNTTQTNSWTKTKDNVINIFASSLCAFCVSGDTLYATGWNGLGHLGLGDTTQRNVWTQVKTGIVNPEEVVVSSNYENHNSNGNYAGTLFMIDGILYGAGYNGAYNIISQSTTQQNSLIRVTDGLGNPLTTPKGTKFVMHPLETVILIPNGGNMDLYTGGNGVYGHGDSRTSTQKLGKVKTFEGSDWDIITNFSPFSYGDQVECFIIYSKSKQEAWAWGANGCGKLGIGNMSNTNTIQKVVLPKRGDRFELQFQFNGGTDEGGLVCVIDDDLFACGYAGYSRLPIASGLFSPISTR